MDVFALVAAAVAGLFFTCARKTRTSISVKTCERIELRVPMLSKSVASQSVTVATLCDTICENLVSDARLLTRTTGSITICFAIAEKFRTFCVSTYRFGTGLTLTINARFSFPDKAVWNNLVNLDSLNGPTISCFIFDDWTSNIDFKHLPRTRRLVLMFWASLRRSPAFKVFFNRSLPAKSQKENLKTVSVRRRRFARSWYRYSRADFDFAG